MPSTLDRLGFEAGELLKIIGALAKADGGSAATLRSIGWDLPPGGRDLGLAAIDVSTLVQKLETLEQSLDGNADDAILAAQFAEVLLEVQKAFVNINGTINGLTDIGDYLEKTNIKSEILGRLTSLLIASRVGAVSPLAFVILQFFGVIKLSHFEAEPTIFQVDHIRVIFDWDALGKLLTDPLALIEARYGWGTANFDARGFIANFSGLVEALGEPSRVRPLPRRVEEQLSGKSVPEADANPVTQAILLFITGDRSGGVEAGISLFPLRPTAPGGVDGGIAVCPFVYGSSDVSFPLTDELTLGLQSTVGLDSGIALQFRPGHNTSIKAGLLTDSIEEHISGTALVSLTWAAPDDGNYTLLSFPGGGSIQVGSINFSGGVDVLEGSLSPSFLAKLAGGHARLNWDGSDSFLGSLMPSGGVDANFELGIRWSGAQGLSFEGSASGDIDIPLGLSVSGLRLDALHIGLRPSDAGLALEASLTCGAAIGPVAISVDRVGTLSTLAFHDGNLGPIDVGFDFLAPTGVGLSVDADVITGGGFVGYDPGSGRYSGVLELQAERVGITALGLIDTRLPGGKPGYALLIVLAATFPGIQVGLGFALTGVGGLIGLNRRVDVDTLRARLAAGTAGRVLAPQDPIHNAPALLADLDAVFPVAPGVTVVGPTVQLVWAGLVHFDVGVFIELPGPARVVLLGSVHAEIQRDGASYLSIRVDILGDIDIPASKVSFDAVLIDSHLMGSLDLTGGAAFRFCAGAQPYSVLTLGGFNPAYNPEPLTFPASLTRIAMVHGTPHDELYLRFEGYFAVTSNTLQFGAAVEALLQADHFVIHGTLGFDALIQFVPFHFQIDIRASVHVSYDGHSLAGLTLTGQLSGPGPVVLKAKVCIELLFFDICFSHTFQLGPSNPPPEPTAPDLLATLLAELIDPTRLRANGTDPSVQLHPPDPTVAVPVVIPTGALIWQQHKAPLGLLLDRVGGTPLPVAAQVQASAAGTAATTDWFAPGQFLALTDDQALTRAGYELLPNGLQLAGGTPTDGPAAQASLTITEIRLPAAPPRIITAVTAFPTWLLTQPPRTAAPLVTVSSPAWTLTTPAGVTSGLTAAQALRRADLSPAAHAIPATDHDHPLTITF